MNRKRTIRTLLLLLSLSLPFLAVSLWFESQLYVAKQSAKALLSDHLAIEDVVELKMSLTDARTLEWEHDHEFSVDGEMYDVIHSEVKGDTIIYHCHHDSFESEVKRAYTSMLISLANRSQQDSKQAQYTTGFFKSLFVSPASPELPVFQSDAGNIKAAPDVSLYADFIPGEISPPPELYL